MDVSLKKLSELFGVSGHEDEVRKYLRSIAADRCDKLMTDAMGNLIAFRRGRSDKKRVLIGSNMDEPGFIVSGITDAGYLKFKTVGSPDPRTAVSKRVVTNGSVKGVIGMKAIHLQTKKEREAAVEASSLYIDIGCSKRSSAEKRVSLGDYIAFDTGFKELGRMIRGKALGRFGTLCVLRAMETEPAYDTYYVFSAQREIPCRIPGRGMACAAHELRPDAAFIVNVIPASGLGDECGEDAQLGSGAVIVHSDRSSIGNSLLTAAVRSAADAKNIKYQERVCGLYSTEAGAVQTAAKGCITACVGIPCRYLDTPVNMMNKNDLNGAAELIAALSGESDVIINDVEKEL